MLIIGSVALNKRLGKTVRAPRDYDIIATYDEAMAFIDSFDGKLDRCYPTDGAKKLVAFKGGRIIEAEIAWEGTLAEELLAMAEGETYASLNILYALKMSHRYLRNSPAFLKTMRDIHLLRGAGAELTPDLESWFKRREAETYDYSHPDLTVSKGQFFKPEEVEYTYDHDSLHVTQKHLDLPAYCYFLADGAEVQCSREKFEALPHKTKLLAVLEESYVLALERSQIPFGDAVSRRKSFEIALMKVCTSITSGWFREFAWENYDEVLSLYSDDYVDFFRLGLDAGIVKPFDG